MPLLAWSAAGGDGCALPCTQAAFRYALEVNVVAPLALTQALLPRLRAAAGAAEGGRVLHLGTGVAHAVQPGTGTYGITKLAFHRTCWHVHTVHRTH